MLNAMRKIIIGAIVGILLLASIGFAIFLTPSFQERLVWHMHQWYISLRTWLNPPQEVAFSSLSDFDTDSDLLPENPGATPAPVLSSAEEQEAVKPVYTPVPSAFAISGGRYYSQHERWNYCGPASIAMLLSYWEWEGNHDDAARELRTNSKDKNVMPYELVDYVREETGLGAIVRVGGDLDVLKRLIAAGYPVLVEKGPHFRDIYGKMTWMGHYQVLSGYNEQTEYFIAQDPYIQPDYKQPFHKLIEEWRSFNYTYIVVYPNDEEEKVLDLLGEDAAEYRNYQNALEKAQAELYRTTGVDQFFAMFNYGTNLMYLRDYNGAATAYDQAFMLYDALPEDLSTKPYRILWYQTGPFFAYYYTGRYDDVIEKTTRNSIEMVRDDAPALEESYYWRGIAKIAIGEKADGIEDFLTCLEYHRGFQPCVDALNDQGIFP